MPVTFPAEMSDLQLSVEDLCVENFEVIFRLRSCINPCICSMPERFVHHFWIHVVSLLLIIHCG